MGVFIDMACLTCRYGPKPGQLEPCDECRDHDHWEAPKESSAEKDLETRKVEALERIVEKLDKIEKKIFEKEKKE